MADLRAAAAAAHQRGDLRLRRQRDLRRRSTTRRSGCCKARMFSDLLSRLHFWGWQLIIVVGRDHAAAGHHPEQGVRRAGVADRHRDRRGLGRLRGQLLRHDREAARAAPLRGDLVLHRHDRHGRGAAHLQQPASCPAGLFKSYPIYAGVQDAFMQWWYGHNAVAFFLTTPFLGLMYYFLPKAAEPAGLLATGCRSCTSGRWSSSTSGPGRTTCTTPRCRTGRRRWACSSRSCSGCRPGAACSTAC